MGCNAHYAPCRRTQHCWQTTSNIVGQQCCARLHVAKSFNGFKLCATTLNNTRQQATGYAKRTQLVLSNNVGSCWPIILRPFAGGGLYASGEREDSTNETLGRPCQSLTEMNCFRIALKLAFSLRKSIHCMKTCLAKLSFESAYVKIWRDDSKEPSLPALLQVTTCCEVFSKL